MISTIINQAKSAKRKIQEIISGEEPTQKAVKKRRFSTPRSTKTVASKPARRDAEVADNESKKLQKRSVSLRSSPSSKSISLKRADSKSTINRMKSVLKSKTRSAAKPPSPAPSRRKSTSVAKASMVKTTAASVRSRVEKSVRGARRSQATLGSVNGGLGLVGSSSSTIRIIGGED